ncbi:MAG: porin [Alphaproteobacteria bacterium]|jgi:predicted porin|nr:porin [Alphaproteobacteria bacterium]
MLKKSLTVIASSLLVASMANATELYNNDGTTFSIGGRLDMGLATTTNTTASGKFHDVGTLNNSRINFAGSRQLNEDTKVFGKVEWGFDANAGDSSPSPVTKNRLANAGISNKTFGTITYGKQYGTFYDVSGFTDMYEISGGDANYLAINSDLIGLNRPDSTLRYDNKFRNANFAIYYASKDSGQYKDNASLELTRKYAAGSSVIVDVAEGLKVGVATNYALLGNTIGTGDTNEGIDISSTVFGLSYDSDLFAVAITGSFHTIGEKNGITGASLPAAGIIGQESYFAFKLGKPALVYVGNNFQVVDFKDWEDLGMSTDSIKTQNYVALGAKYSFTESFVTAIEYRADLRSSHDLALAGESARGDQLAAVIKYYF